MPKIYLDKRNDSTVFSTSSPCKRVLEDGAKNTKRIAVNNTSKRSGKSATSLENNLQHIDRPAAMV